VGFSLARYSRAAQVYVLNVLMSARPETTVASREYQRVRVKVGLCVFLADNEFEPFGKERLHHQLKAAWTLGELHWKCRRVTGFALGRDVESV